MSITWYWPTTTIPSEWNHGSLASEDGKFGGGKIRRQELIRFQFSHSRFGESIREQPHAQTEFIGVIYPSPERWLNPWWKMSRRFQTLMPMIPFKLIISESHLSFTFFILDVDVSVLTAVAVFIINAVIVSVVIFFFYLFYMMPTKDCKTRTPSSSSPLQKSFSLRLQPLESGGVRETGVNEHQLILTNDNDIRWVKSWCFMLIA